MHLKGFIFTIWALCFACLVANAAQSEPGCQPDENLRARGFIIHQVSEFSQFAAKKIDLRQKQAADFVFDTESRWRDHTLHRSLWARSWDRISTSQEEMYGDLFVISDLYTGVPIEVRWYDGKKHVVYDSSVQPCANGDFIPWADNALF